MRIVLGTCHHDCPDSCGWQVTVDDAGTAVKLRGNPEHPYSQGELCPKVNRFLDRVYAPDRILHPLIRTGAKGAGQFRQATWDEALALVADNLRRVTAEHGGEAIMPWGSAGTQGLIQQSSLDRTFFARLGATRQTGSVCGLTAGAGTATAYGTGKASDPLEVVHSDLVILWGVNVRLTNRHLWPFIEQARARGAQVICIDPVRTITAESSDWFIQPLPGTDVAMILAIVNLLVQHGHIDHDYVARHANGYDELVRRAAEWTPERAAEACGVSADDIRRLADVYGRTDKAFIRTMIGPEHYEHGAMFFRTLATLPVITGKFRHLGGGLARSVGSYCDVNVDDSVFNPAEPLPTRSINVTHLGRSLTDPAVGVYALVVWNGNPVISIPNAGAIRRGLSRDDLFTVVSEQFMTDTAKYADVVFPATTEIEHLDVIPAWGHTYLGWNEAAIEPLGEAVPNTELWRRLAKTMGFDDPIFALTDEELILSALRDVDIAEIRSNGFVAPSLPSPLRKYSDGGFGTADGKADLAVTNPPAFTPPQARTNGRLYLQSPKTHSRFLNSSYSHHHGKLEGGPYLELSADDAAAHSIADGDCVKVSNANGSLELPARITERLRPGVVAIPWGWWGEDSNVNVLTNDELADWGGGVGYSETLVDIALAH